MYSSLNAGAGGTYYPSSFAAPASPGPGTAGYTGQFTAADAMAHNQQQYNDIIAGYKTQQDDYARRSADVSKGYHQLTDQAMGYLKGSQAGMQQNLDNQYARNMAGLQSNMVSRGLGNTTAVEGAQRGVQGEYNQANIGLHSQYAGQLADTLGRYGSQATGYDAHVAEQLAGLHGGQLGMMGGYLQGGQQIFGNLAGAQQNFGYQHALNQQGADLGLANQAQLNQQNYQYQSALQGQQHRFQQEAADADLARQNQYDLSGGGYAGG